MAEKTLNLEIFALGRAPIRLAVTQVCMQGAEGQFTILPGHAALIGMLAIGVIEVIVDSGEERAIAITRGFVEVLDDHVVVLTTSAEMDSEIDLARAEQAKTRAEERIENAHGIDIDLARAEVALKRAMMRIQASRRGGTPARNR